MRSLFTEADNATWCPVRVFGVVFAVATTAVFMGLAVHTVVALRQPLDYLAFAKADGLIWAVVAGAIIGKQWVEDLGNDQ